MGKKRKVGRPPLLTAEHRRLADVFREKITSGQWARGASVPSRRALAAAHDVGDHTVRLALNKLRGEGWINKNPRNRFIVRADAPRGKDGRPMNAPLVIVVAQSLDTYLTTREHQAILRGILREAGATESPVTMLQHEHYAQHLPANVDSLSARGVLLLGTFRYKAMHHYQRMAWPTVMVNRPGLRWRVHAIRGNNIGGMLDATRRLFALGHRRIAFARLLQMQLREIDAHSRQRHNGYLEAFHEAGRKAPSDWCFNVTPYDQHASPSIQSLFEADPPFTAVIAADAARARLILRAAEARGVRVPEELSVICLQGIEPDAPEVTGPRVDFEALGRAAVRLLSEPNRTRQRAVMPTQWIVAETLVPVPV